MAAFVRVSGPPNSSFLVGYPGISATLVSRRRQTLSVANAFGQGFLTNRCALA